MFVYICCAGGLTSSLLCEKIQNCSTEDFKIHINPIRTIVSEINSGKLNEFDLILGYGDVGRFNQSFISELNLSESLDLLLISPQVRFELNRIRKVLAPYNIPSDSIDMLDFGTMNGAKLIKTILSYKQ